MANIALEPTAPARARTRERAPRLSASRSAAEAFRARYSAGSSMNGSSEKFPTPFDDGEVYDLLLKDIPYGFDFYTGLAKEAKGPVLDVCCGTGRILLPCLQAGVDIEGLDLFA